MKKRLIAFSLGMITVIQTGWTLPVLEDLIQKNEKLELVIGKSEMLALRSPAERVSVVSTEVADVQILEPQQLLVTASAVGETSLIVWMQDGSMRTLDVAVKWNTQQIKHILQIVMPDEPIDVLSLDDGIALRGSVSDIVKAEQAVELAKSFVPNVINLLHVPGLQQVMLKVKIAEVARSFGDEFGVDMRFNNDSMFSGSLTGNLISGNLDSNPINISDAATAFFGFPNANFDIFFRTLKDKGLLYILAEPNLIARSGETASFLAGGEFPIPIVQNAVSNSITIEYKEFGVRLNFTPTVVGPHTVQMDIAPEVSDLDFSRGVTIGGFTIPVITTRRASTSVKIDHGQSFAIAGLIDTKKQHSNKKIPYASSIPIFGSLFKSKALSEVETELLILVTPYLVAPIEDTSDIKMPTEIYDAETGQTEKLSSSTQSAPKTQTLESVQISTHQLPSVKAKVRHTNLQPIQNNTVYREQDWMDSSQFESNGQYAAKAK